MEEVTMRIVIIDNPTGIDVLKSQLQKINIRCDVVGTATDYETGCCVVLEQAPEILFMNIHMEQNRGVKILRRLRSKFVYCPIVAIMEDSIQALSQEIINMKICGCIVRPFAEAELYHVIEQARIDVELIHNRTVLYSLENLMTESVYGHFSLNPRARKYIHERYGLSKYDTLGILGVWLGEEYKMYAEQVGNGMATMDWGQEMLKNQLVYLPGMKMVLMVFYPLTSQTIYSELQHKVTSDMQAFLPAKCILVAERCYGIENMQSVVIKMYAELEWNLVLGRGTVINEEIIRTIRIVELVYPEKLDARVEQAVAKNSRAEFEVCFKQLMNCCRREIHTPQMIKAVCMQYCWLIIRLSKKNNNMAHEVFSHDVIAAVSRAVYWKEIWEALIRFSRNMLAPELMNVNVSILVIRARRMMEEFYSTGITLEEVAARLHVTTEYLSSLFKKETGTTFSETIRNYRVEKIKEYLSESTYSITKIAEKTGYTDPKYMSKVFKEVVGVRPTDYRKLNNIK